MSTDLSTPSTPHALSLFSTASGFALLQEEAKLIAASSLIPEAFRNNAPNCAIALEMAHRLNASPMAVIQNLDVIHGRPSWRAVFLIGLVNGCGRFSPLDFQLEVTGAEKTETVTIAYYVQEGNQKTRKEKKINWTYTPTRCRATATVVATGKEVFGPWASYDMALEEGWVSKDGSKWLTSMRELMLTYRAASFFAKIFASDVMLGMQTAEEMEDIPREPRTVTGTVSNPEPGASPEAAPVEVVQSPAKEPTTRAPRGGGTAKTVEAQAEPVKEPEKAADAGPARGRRVKFVSSASKSGVSGRGNDYTKVTVNFEEDGTQKAADTLSESLHSVIGSLQMDDLIDIETSPGSQARYNDTLTWMNPVNPRPAKELPAQEAEWT